MRAEFNTGLTPYILHLMLGGFVCLLPLQKTSASILEGLLSPLSIFRIDAVEEEERRIFLFYLFGFVLVDTHLYPAVWR